ncbi:hypothetical protein BS78_08G170400 [Paspalum vaginatum]|nr:hypothetical protein BS78_08G170400 [Paspalum vaginatum]
MAAARGPGGAVPPAMACAACKYQRRRCTPDCPLAAYFPHDRPRVFRNAHRLFGVSNILKTLKIAGPVKRDEAMRSIIIESQAWDVNPAAGCVPVILELDRMVRQAQLQLRQVQEAIEAYKSGHQQAAAEHRRHSTDGGGDDLALEQQMRMMTMAPPPPLYDDDGMMAVDAMLVPQQLLLLPQQQDQHQLLADDGTTTMVPPSHQSQPQHQQQPVFSIFQTPPPPPELHDETVMSYLLDDAAGDEMQMPHECTSSVDYLEKNMVKAPNILEDGTNNGFKQDDEDAAPMAGACFTATLAGGADQS